MKVKLFNPRPHPTVAALSDLQQSLHGWRFAVEGKSIRLMKSAISLRPLPVCIAQSYVFSLSARFRAGPASCMRNCTLIEQKSFRNLKI